MQKTIAAITALVVVLLCAPFALAQMETLSGNTKSATVFIANFNAKGDFVGWGSGFYVDEGIVVTNKHVIEAGKFYKIFPTDSSDVVNLNCGKQISRSDVKINLDNDVAYMRVYVECPHGAVQFADEDPIVGDQIGIIGFPNRGSFENSLSLSYSQGGVKAKRPDTWLSTDAYLQFGNSGGPVIIKDKVVGVAVAKGTDANGDFVEGYFVPTSVILKGLLDANDSTFGYTPQNFQKNPAYSSSSFSSARSSAYSSFSRSSSSASSVSRRVRIPPKRVSSSSSRASSSSSKSVTPRQRPSTRHLVTP